MMLSGADILVRTLIEQGVDTVFGYPGGQILNVYDSLYKYQSEITHVLTAHEQGAAHAADGYARTTGRVGVVISTSGPGATNLVTGIATAYLDSIPMVALCGNVPTTQIGTDSFQEIDITGVTLPITKHNYFVGLGGRTGTDHPRGLPAGPVRAAGPGAHRRAQGRADRPVRVRGPAPGDRGPAHGGQRAAGGAGGGPHQRRPPALRLLRRRSGGRRGAKARCWPLAEKLDAPIGCSLTGISGIPTSHPRFLGMQGMHGHYASSLAMHNADLIISLGVRFNDRVTGDRSRFAPGARIVQIDVDGSELSKNVPAAVGLRGDVKQTLQRLLPLVNEVKNPEWQEKLAKLRAEEAESADRRPGLTPRNAILTLNKFLGENTPVATDVGQHQMWAAQNLRFKKPRRFASSGGLGTMGYGMGAAIGAAYGTGERSVLVTGDGSFGMCLNELATAVTYRVPVVILLMNNGVLGMVRQWQTLFYGKRYSNTILGPQDRLCGACQGPSGPRARRWTPWRVWRPPSAVPSPPRGPTSSTAPSKRTNSCFPCCPRAAAWTTSL